VDKPGTGGTQADQLFVFDHTFGVEDGDPLTDDAPPIAWNKLHMTGSKHGDFGVEISPDKVITWKDPEDKTMPLIIHQQIIDVGDAIYAVTKKTFDTFSPLADATEFWGRTKGQILSEVPASTAFVSYLHGTKEFLLDGKLASEGGALEIPFVGAGVDNWQAKKATGAGNYPPYWFAANFTCETLPHPPPLNNQPDRNLSSLAAQAYGVRELDWFYIGYFVKVAGVVNVDLDGDGVKHELVTLADVASSLWSKMEQGNQTIGDAVTQVNSDPNTTMWGIFASTPTILVGDPDVRYPWVYMKKSETDHATSLGKVINRLWLPLTGTGEIDWERY
jgi:hypothetical protein